MSFSYSGRFKGARLPLLLKQGKAASCGGKVCPHKTANVSKFSDRARRRAFFRAFPSDGILPVPFYGNGLFFTFIRPPAIRLPYTHASCSAQLVSRSVGAPFLSTAFRFFRRAFFKRQRIKVPRGTHRGNGKQQRHCNSDSGIGGQPHTRREQRKVTKKAPRP